MSGAVVPDRFVRLKNDKIDQGQFVITFSASTSCCRAGFWRPLSVFAYEPRLTVAYNKIRMEYLYTKNLVFAAEQHFYWPDSGDDQDPWDLGAYLGEPGIRRNETVFTATFQF